MNDFELAEQALRLINAEGHLVAGHNKNPVYPAENWQFHGNQLSIEAAMSAWRSWGDCVRGVGIIARDNIVILDFDPIEKTQERRSQDYETRKAWRAGFEQNLLQYTYAEKSRSGRGSHFVMRVQGNFVGRRGIELFKQYFAIDVLTGSRYCDITGYRINDTPVANDGTGLVTRLLTQMEESYADTDVRSDVQYEHGTFPIACLEELLDYVRIDLEDYSGWLEIGLALFNETNGSNSGLQLWTNWSQKYGGDKYNPHNIAYKWSTFKIGKYKYSVGSIIRHAKAGGANVAQIRLRQRTQQNIKAIADLKEADKHVKWGSK